MNLSSIDPNRLYVLHVVFEERSVTRAAARLHVTPPAVSNTLAALRETLGDPLVIRSGRGLVLTPRALALAPQLAEAVAALARVVAATGAFDAETSTRIFSLACSDAEQIAGVPRIAAAFARRLPAAGLRIASVDALEVSGGLAGGEIDAAIAPETDPMPGHHSTPLYAEEGVLVVRRDHPRVHGPITRELFDELGHVDILLALGRGGIGHRAVEAFFAAHGLQRRIAVSVPSFAAAAAIVSETDWMTGLPRRLAERLVRQLPLRIVEMPIPAMPFRIRLHWHERTDADAGSRLFRSIVVEALGDRSPAVGPG
jgi:DNA-binding transcriptional LysR family regulator